MISVSGNFIDAINSTSRYTNIRGTIVKNGTSIGISENDIVAGSVSISSKAVASSSINLGSVYIDQLSITLLISEAKPFSNISNSKITIEFGIELSENVFEWIQVGVFDISNDNVTRHKMTVAIKANSNMHKFDKLLNGLLTSGTPYDIANWCCNACDVVFGMTSSDLEPFANSQYTLTLVEGNGCETYRDVLMWVSQILGCFATISNTGALVFKRFIGVSQYTINPDIIETKEFSDSNVVINNAYMTVDTVMYQVDETATRVSSVELDTNPFFLERGELYIQTCIDNMSTDLIALDYIPFKLTFNGNPALQVGDYITVAGNAVLITSSTWKHRGKCTLQGVGLSTSSSKTQGSTVKGGTGGGGSTTESFCIVKFENSADIVVNASNKLISSIVFELDASTVPLFGITFIIHVTEADDLQLTLEYDNVTLAFLPKYTLPVGYHTISLTLPLDAREEAMTHILYASVKFLSSAGAGTILMTDAKSFVEGKGANSSTIEWNGRITVNEEVPILPVEFGTVNVIRVSATPSITLDDAPTPITVNEEVPILPVEFGTVNVIGVSATPSITFDDAPTPTPVVSSVHGNASEATLRGKVVLRSNSSAESGYDLDYLGLYSTRDASWNFSLDADSTASEVIVKMASDDSSRSINVYIDGNPIALNVEGYSRSWTDGLEFVCATNVPISAGSHTITISSSSSSYAPLVDYFTISF